MEFTYYQYGNLLSLLEDYEYQISNYHNWRDNEKCVILRHDIDYDVAKAVQLAKFEFKKKVTSTFFILLTSGFYNVFSRHNVSRLKKIADCGHEIGLHFDEARYNGMGLNGIRGKIVEECEILSNVIGNPVTTVSMHRPSKVMLEADLKIPGIVNSYGNEYFYDFKYISDSRRRWKESVEDIIKSGEYDRLHILTHAFWYNETERDLHDSLAFFIKGGNKERYEIMSENFTGLQDEIVLDEVIGGMENGNCSLTESRA